MTGREHEQEPRWRGHENERHEGCGGSWGYGPLGGNGVSPPVKSNERWCFRCGHVEEVPDG